MKSWHHFSVEDQHKIIQERISGGYIKSSIYGKSIKSEGINLSLPGKNKLASAVDQNNDLLQMQRRIFELEQQLKEAEIKVITYAMMVDLVEKEFKIPIK